MPNKKVPKKAATIQKIKNPFTVGASLPPLELAGTGGAIKLSALKGDPVVLFFYPRDATPGCTQEAHDFSRLLPKFKALGAHVFGISRDTLASHEKFKAKERYALDLLSDADEASCGLFGVMKMKNMYGKQVRGVERSTFVFSRAGRLVKEWRGVKVPGHAEDVYAFVKSLG